MSSTKRSIGSQGLEQGGMNLGNDYSRSLSRDRQTNDEGHEIIVQKHKHNTGQKSAAKEAQNPRKGQTLQQKRK